MTHEVIICACENVEHQIIFSYFEDEDDIPKEVFMTIHLVHEPNIFKRIWKGIKYIFGYKCRYGNFDEIILNKSHIRQLNKIVNYLDSAE
jgi:hypothetical protein